MVKCSKCKKKIKTTFLNKIKGTWVKGKAVCKDCQVKMNKKK